MGRTPIRSVWAFQGRDRFQADTATTTGDQRLAFDAGVFTAWLQAHSVANSDLEATLLKRMTPEYKVAFDAWLQTDPFANPTAPSGPGAVMSQYKNPELEQAAKLNATASATFEEGTTARETGGGTVRDTVLFAMVLFLVAIAQRMKDRTPSRRREPHRVVARGLTIFSVVRLPRL